MDELLLRLASLRPAESGAVFDNRLRANVLPALMECEGLVASVVGRHGPDESGVRMLVTVWQSQGFLTAALDDEGAGGGFERDMREEVAQGRVEVLPVAIAIAHDATTPAQVLRVFRGETRDGELESYLAEAHEGTLADIEAGHGPLALYLALAGNSSFVTVSVWRDWETIQVATGGNIRHPIATQHANRLVRGRVSHFEILPDGAARFLGPTPAGG